MHSVAHSKKIDVIILGVCKTQELETIRGSVESIIFHNEESGYTVLDVASEGELITAVGELSNVNVGEEVALHGLFKSSAKFGNQFRVEAYEISLPQGAAAIQKYLASGALPYIGKAMAARIVSEFGEETLEIIATNAKRLSGIKGLSYDKALTIQNEYKRVFGVREAITYLGTLGVGAPAAIALFKHFGPEAAEVVQQNPYVMCAYPTYLEFAAADRIAGDLSLEYDSHERVCAGIVYVLRHNLQNGHTCLPKPRFIQTVSEFLHVDPDDIARALELLLEEETLYAVTFREKDYIYLPDLLRAEQSIAHHMRYLSKIPRTDAKNVDKSIHQIELVSNIRYAPLQRKAIADALSHYALVLTGGPGTGKTTAVNGMLAAFEQNGDRVSLTAPTGRAAKRLSELTSRKAATIHRLLEVDHTSESGIVRFIHNEKNLLKCDVVVIDEMSMVDTMLFESLLLALKPACKIIMVGDEDQLPSVGAGNVLGSMMASGIVPVVRLTEIFRQAAASKIVSNAHRIVAGEVPEIGGAEDDFFFLSCQSADQCAKLVCDLVCRRLPQAYGFDAREDILVLTPTKIGPLGTVALNVALQERINPPAPHKPQLNLREKILRVGDKVMQIKNNYDIPYTRPEGGEDGAGAFNGDIGVIEEVNVAAGSLVVRSEDRCLVYTSDHVRELEPAYAVTIHKSQGSEYAAVVMPLFDIPPKLCYRNLLYTGVTRARKLCVLAGRKGEMAQMVANVKRNKRFSCLSDFLQEENL